LKTILIAPDKFKSSLTARQVCSSIEAGIHLIDPDIKVISIPLADGGEGTCELLTEYSNGSYVKIAVLNPLLNQIESGYGISSDGKTAFIEMAKASGLQLLDYVDRNPLVTSTFGTGQLIQHAMESGARHIIMGIGGSATNDAGIGLADALGFSFLSSSGERLKPIGENLINIDAINQQLVHPLLSQTKFTVLCDVDNPLHGKNGAAYVFAPQKGASPDDVERLDTGLKNFEKIMGKTFNSKIDFAGAGAAGGVGAGSKAFLNAEIKMGFDFVSMYTNLEESIRTAELIITGEGKIDIQTLSGKVVKGVAELSRKHAKRCVAFTGKLELSQELSSTLNIEKIISLTDIHTTDIEAITNAFSILRNRTFIHLAPIISTH